MSREPVKDSSMYRLVQQLVDEAFVAEDRRQAKSIASIIRQNNELQSKPQTTALMYAGQTYGAVDKLPRGMGTRQMDKVSLHPELEEKMAFHVQSSKDSIEDRRMIGQVIFLMLDGSRNVQDIRDTLPDCFAESLALADIPRVREVGCTLSDSDKSAALPYIQKIEFLFAARLLY